MKYDAEKKEILLDKELNNLDRFALKFVQIIERYVNYVIISGYVSILLGRTRITEDIDMFIKPISFEEFSKLYKELEKNGFWCINAEKTEDVYSYLKDGYAVRFSIKDKSVPNFEVKFPKADVDNETFEDFIVVILKEGSIKISSLERQIAFKRYYLKSDKDIEDATHIEEIFKGRIDYAKINKIKESIRSIKQNKNG